MRKIKRSHHIYLSSSPFLPLFLFLGWSRYRPSSGDNCHQRYEANLTTSPPLQHWANSTKKGLPFLSFSSCLSPFGCHTYPSPAGNHWRCPTSGKWHQTRSEDDQIQATTVVVGCPLPIEPCLSHSLSLDPTSAMVGHYLTMTATDNPSFNETRPRSSP